MSVYELGNGLRLVDLTKVLDPATESRRCHLIRYNTGGPIPDFHTALDLTTHLGTHCECPYHHFEDGKSVGDLPLTTFMGRAIYVNIDFLEPNAHIGDGVSIENCNEDVKPFHDILMEVDIVFLEVLKNLEELSTDTFFMSYTPLPLIGADSMPVRAYAIEGLPGFTA